jgi:hypothetical protein
MKPISLIFKELEDSKMKKQIIIILVVAVLLTSGVFVYGMPSSSWTLGKVVYREPTEEWIIDGWKFGVSTIVFEYGTITYFGDGRPPTEYHYGQEDLPGAPDDMCKTIAVNQIGDFGEDVYFDIFVAENLKKPMNNQTKLNKKDISVINGIIKYDFQNLNINIENGKPYIIVLRNEKGIVLQVDKVILVK